MDIFDMNKILINFAHPARARSKINNALRSAVENLDGITFNDLYANYPDFLIDVKKEQSLCESHDVIIFQHPFWHKFKANNNEIIPHGLQIFMNAMEELKKRK